MSLRWQGSRRKRWSKRKVRGDATDGEQEGIEMVEFLQQALVLRPSEHTFNMNIQDDKKKLCKMLWGQDDMFGHDSLSAANVELTAAISVLVRNAHSLRRQDSTDAEDVL